MEKQYICELEDRALIRVAGEDADEFLQGILTCNLESIKNNSAGFGGLLTPQGKILFDFFILRDDHGFVLDIMHDHADELIRRLTFYRLRAKVSLERETSFAKVFALWGGEKPPREPSTGILTRDPRLAEMGWRYYGGDKLNDTDGEYNFHRLSVGMPEAGHDYQYGETFPHEALYDQIGAVDFAKGCYVGQEVISRMHHRGTARKRIVKIAGKNSLPSHETRILADGKPVGEVLSSHEGTGLAILRLDRAKEAIDAGHELIADDGVLVAALQDWVNFDWPEPR